MGHAGIEFAEADKPDGITRLETEGGGFLFFSCPVVLNLDKLVAKPSVCLPPQIRRRRWRALRDRTERNRDYFYLVTDESYYGDKRQTALGIPGTGSPIDIGRNRENVGSARLVRKVLMRPERKKVPLARAGDAPF